MSRVLIEDGPHAGMVVVTDEADPTPDTLDVMLPPSRPGFVEATRHRYRRQRSQPDDFVQGFVGRYRWES
jgi:hypothetical protein